MGAPVDDDLGAQDLLAVVNLVDNDVAGAPVQHARVRAVQVNQSLEGPLGRVYPFRVTRDDAWRRSCRLKWSMTVAPFSGFV